MLCVYQFTKWLKVNILSDWMWESKIDQILVCTQTNGCQFFDTFLQMLSILRSEKYAKVLLDVISSIRLFFIGGYFASKCAWINPFWGSGRVQAATVMEKRFASRNAIIYTERINDQRWVCHFAWRYIYWRSSMERSKYIVPHGCITFLPGSEGICKEQNRDNIQLDACNAQIFAAG